MRLKFVIEKKYDLEIILSILDVGVGDRTTLISHAKNMGLDFIFSEKILPDSKKYKNIVKKTVEERYKKVGRYLNKTISLYQKSWDEINAEFFKTTVEITGYSWKYKVYYCVLSPFHRGIGSWGGNKVIRSWRENPYTMRKITAHELLISHIFTMFERDFQKENLTNKEKWSLAEISAWAITGLEKKMLKFWPWITKEEKYPFNHNYPELYKLQKKLRPKYEKKKNFKKFLIEGIKIIKKDKKIL